MRARMNLSTPQPDKLKASSATERLEVHPEQRSSTPFFKGGASRGRMGELYSKFPPLSTIDGIIERLMTKWLFVFLRPLNRSDGVSWPL